MLALSSVKSLAKWSLGMFTFSFLLSAPFSWGDWSSLVWPTSIAFFTGLVGAPVLEPEHFENPWILQAVFGGVAGALLVPFFDVGLVWIALFAPLGSVAGVSAKHWVREVHLP